jgi:hypothetical protein
MDGPVSDVLKAAIAEENLKHLGSIPDDDRLLSRDRAGQPVWEALPGSPAYGALDRIMKGLMAR